MNKEFNNIREAVQSLKLSDNEKALMKSNIIAGVTASSFSSVTNPVPSRLYYQWNIGNYINLAIKHNNFMMALLITIMLAAGGGSSVMAEKAIPGDALYQMKVVVNEPVIGLFTLSKEGNTAWQERLVERRLEEVQKVVAQGTLSTSTQVEMEVAVRAQIDKFALAVKDLSGNKNTAVISSELAIRLESALRAHQDILEKVVADGTLATSTKETTKDLLSSLKEDESQVKSHREEAELHLGDNENNANASSTPEVAALNKQAVAEKILANVQEKYLAEKVNLATSTRSNIEQELSAIEKILVEGKADVATAKYNDAREKFQNVIQLSNDTRVTIVTSSIKGDLEVDLGSNFERENKNESNDSENSTSSVRKNDNHDNKNGTSSVDKDSDEENATSSAVKSEKNKNDNNGGALKIDNQNSLKIESANSVEKGDSVQNEDKVDIDTKINIGN